MLTRHRFGCIVALAVGVNACTCHAQLSGVLITQHAESEATLAWSNGSPPSVASNSQTLLSAGSLDVPSSPSNGGIPSVAAEGRAITEVNTVPGGYVVVASGLTVGHSNLAAIASASYLSISTLQFSLAQPLDITLELTFQNGAFGDPGIGSGHSSMELIGPAGQSLLAYTHAGLIPTYTQNTQMTLAPGNYLLRLESQLAVQFGPGLSETGQYSVGVVTLTVPSAGALPCLGLLAFSKRRRRS